MKAAVITGYGGPDRLELREIDPPSPGATEVLLRVEAASVNPIDWKLRQGHLRFVWRLKFPFVPGFDVAGVVQQVGRDVTKWKEGDAVYAALPNGGGHAEYVVLEESFCVAKSTRLTFEEAAAVPGGALSALQALRDVANAQSADHVIVNGASGGVGAFAVQIAAAFGCQVTAVTSTRNQDYVASLGADAVIDYTRQDVREAGPCDVFFDVVPNRSFRDCAQMLSPNGIYVTTLPGPSPFVWNVLTRVARPFGCRKKCGWLIVKPNRKDLEFVNGLIGDGKLCPTVEHTFALDEICDAYKQSETGHTRGKIVLRTA